MPRSASEICKSEQYEMRQGELVTINDSRAIDCHMACDSTEAIFEREKKFRRRVKQSSRYQSRASPASRCDTTYPSYNFSYINPHAVRYQSSVAFLLLEIEFIGVRFAEEITSSTTSVLLRDGMRLV